MAGRHRKRNPARELIPTAAGATVTALTLVTTTGTLPVITAPVKTVAATQPMRRPHPHPRPALMMLAPPRMAPAGVDWYPPPAARRWYSVPPQTPIAQRPAPVALPTPAPAQTPAPQQAPAAAKAVTAAISQIGSRYVYGGDSPGGFDCSGLIQWAYKQAGINLPRTAAAQASVGYRVSLNDLRPGDLLLYYTPIDHVVMYVGDGKIAEASTFGVPVHVRPLYTNGFVEARRLIN